MIRPGRAGWAPLRRLPKLLRSKLITNQGMQWEMPLPADLDQWLVQLRQAR